MASHFKVRLLLLKLDRVRQRIFHEKVLRLTPNSCYGLRLKSFLARALPPASGSSRNRLTCPEHFCCSVFLALLLLSFFAGGLSAQTSPSAIKAATPSENELLYRAVIQDSNGEWRYLKGSARLETSDFAISADQIDFNSDTNWAYAKGNVRFEHFVSGDKIKADHAEYNIKTQMGRFYEVDGTSPAKVMTSPGILTTTNPFYFKADFADRFKDRYILHKGFVTDCIVPKPWWTFDSSKFDIVPAERAIGHNTLLKLKGVPIFYFPVFYRPLGKNPRRSGFLTPSFGNSSNRGFMLGIGYYWAISRSYDLTYELQYYTVRGPAHTIDFRGKPNDVTDFNFFLYGIQDSGTPATTQSPVRYKEGGYSFNLTGTTQVAGFRGFLSVNYLSSFVFRQAFSQAGTENLSSQTNSVGLLQRRFKDDSYVLNIVGQRTQLFEDTYFDYVGHQFHSPEIDIQRLPSVEFNSRDQEISHGPLPAWVSFDTSAGLFHKQEQSLTGQQILDTTFSVPRVDVEPRVATNFHFDGVSISPSVGLGLTSYGDSYKSNTYANINDPRFTLPVLSSSSLLRKDVDFRVDMTLPAVERVFSPPKWLHLGTKLKHVIETRATYENVAGIGDTYNKLVRFDDLETLSNTNQLEISVTNRLLSKDKNGNVSEILSWDLSQQRYFDQTFGGVVIPNARNIVLAAEIFSPFSFLNGPRNYSPIVSTFRITPYPFLSFDWRSEYDPLYHSFITNKIAANYRLRKYYINVGDTDINNGKRGDYNGSILPVLAPNANQMQFSTGYGSTNRPGWNVGGVTDYDFVQKYIIYSEAQTSYNTNCCGFSMQFRRYAFGAIRNENQFLFSFALANIGTFGSMRKQDRIF